MLGLPIFALVTLLWRALGLTGLGLDSESGVGLEGKRRVVSRARLDKSGCDGVGRGRVESL